MKKRLLKTLTVLCLLCGFFVPIHVFAESATYYPYESGCVNFFKTDRYFVVNTTTSGRGVILHDTINNRYIGYLFSDSFFRNYWTSYTSIPESCTYVNSDSTRYLDKYYVRVTTRVTTGVSITSDFPIVDMNIGSYADNISQYDNKAYQLTYGNEVVDPAPPGPDYGNVANVQYNTRIAGSGAASANNIDRITWDSALDDNSNELPQNARVQIRAIPGQYTGTTKQDLLTNMYHLPLDFEK